MGVIADLKRAKDRADLAGRVEIELVRVGDRVVEARAAPLVPPPTSGSLADLPFTNAAAAPDTAVPRRRVGGRWRPVTAAEFAGEVARVARGLIHAGLQPGGRVALMSRTRYEWCLLDFAIWAAGGQTVPVYPTASAEQVAWILRDSGALTWVTETRDHTAVVTQADRSVGADPAVWCLQDGAIERLAGDGAAVAEDELTRRRQAMSPQDVATIVYTSGTTGNPKGCVLTHANLQAESGNLVEMLHPVFVEITGRQASTLLFLPLAHILGRTLQIACLQGRIELGHWPSIDPDELRPQFAEFRPTFLVGVPYLFEKIHDTARATAERLGRGASFERADRIAVRAGEAALQWFYGEGPAPPLRLMLARALYDLLVYRRVRAALGGRLRYAISGGSPLDPRLNLFFMGAGIVIYEGYGLTETTAAATVAPPLAPRPGTVGPPVPGTAVRIADDGEVLVKGGIVFHSYWNNADATGRSLDGGWFATGDLGELDERGYLRIVGRKKDILITAGGKNVSPAVLEDRLRSRPPVGQCMVVGDAAPYIAALVTLEPAAVDHWLSVRERPADTPIGALCTDPDMRAAVQRAVDYANEAVSRAESIRRFRIVPGEFTEDNGMLTPSMKVRRDAVARAYAADIAALYAGRDDTA